MTNQIGTKGYEQIMEFISVVCQKTQSVYLSIFSVGNNIWDVIIRYGSLQDYLSRAKLPNFVN